MSFFTGVNYNFENNLYELRDENGKVHTVTPEDLGRARYQVRPTQKLTGFTDMDEGLKKYADESIADFKKSYIYSAPLLFNTFKPKTTTPETMTRLTTSGEWTIALKNGKLFAFNEHGNTIEAVGSLISVDGKAWLYKNGSLWSGVLEKVTTEREEYNQKLDDRRAKQQALIHKSELKIQKIREAFEKQLENL
jgi:hypothetical protein